MEWQQEQKQQKKNSHLAKLSAGQAVKVGRGARCTDSCKGGGVSRLAADSGGGGDER